MPTDLTQVHDHPERVLLFAATRDPLRLSVDEARRACIILSNFQSNAYVTFAALDNDALAQVREIYAAWGDSGVDDAYDLLVEFASAVSDLLGLE